MRKTTKVFVQFVLCSVLMLLVIAPDASAQIKIKFAPKDKGLLFETQVYAIEVPGVPVHFEEGEVLFTKDINNSTIKPSIKYIPDIEAIEGIEFGIVVFNYFHEFIMAFPAVEAEPVPAGKHGKWVNVRPWGQFVPFSLDYFVYVRKVRFKSGKVVYYENADSYVFEQIQDVYDGDVWLLDHSKKFTLEDIVYYNTKDYGLSFQDYRMRFDR